MAATSDGGARVTLPTDDQILITREFDAPRHLLYEAWTTPELVRRWWAGRRGEMTVVEMDVRVGGAYRYAMVAEEGVEVAFHGEYREVVPDERIVTTEVYEAMPDAEPAINTITFAEAGGRTTVSLLMQVASREVRDMVLATGMEGGVQEQLDLIEEIAATMR